MIKCFQNRNNYYQYVVYDYYVKDTGGIFMEKKTKTTMFSFKPSVFTSFKKIVHMQDTSMNDVVHQLVEKYVTEHQNLVKSYDEHIVPIEKV